MDDTHVFSTSWAAHQISRLVLRHDPERNLHRPLHSSLNARRPLRLRKHYRVFDCNYLCFRARVSALGHRMPFQPGRQSPSMGFLQRHKHAVLLNERPLSRRWGKPSRWQSLSGGGVVKQQRVDDPRHGDLCASYYILGTSEVAA